MTEEHACLVRAHSDSENSSKLGSFGSIRTMDKVNEGAGGDTVAPANVISQPDNEHADDSGELIHYNDSTVLEQFHEDAIRQAGCGIAQARVMLATSLALAGAMLELSAIPLVLPSAEIEFCIQPHEKNWLVLISLVGGSLGAVGWGVLAERLGRRRTLLSCLAVNAVFATIAAFMPTYGTFMMARFCSAIGSGGIIPTSFTYLCESCSVRVRPLCAASAPLAAGAGALLATGLARVILPHNGEATLLENKEHFSAWHRYLLLCTLPILASLVSLIWTQESPRYLLDVGREVDAMMVYQNIHTSNQIQICGKKPPACNCESAYRLGELALPGKRRPPAIHQVRHSVKMFWQAFFQLFSSAHRNTTLSFGGTLIFSMAIGFYLSGYIPATVEKLENDRFEASKRTIQDVSFDNGYYNETMENVDYLNATFFNCTFRDMLMSHVAFKNCSFLDVAFSNIKTSYTKFESVAFFNSTIIDTDIEIGRELDAKCVLNNTVIRGMRGGCGRHASLAWNIAGRLARHTYTAHGVLLAALPARFITNNRRADTVSTFLCVACAVLSPAIYVANTETTLYIVEAIYRFLLTLLFFIICISLVDLYPANLRCVGHGLSVSAMYMCGAIVRGAGQTAAIFSAVLCAILAVCAALCTRTR